MTLISGVGLRDVLLVIAALMLGGCSWGQLKGDPGSSSATGKDNTSRDTTSFSPSSDARKDLGDALRKLKTAYPYRLTETTSSIVDGQAAGPTYTRLAEFAAPDRSHVKISSASASDVETIHIGDRQYWYSNGKWSENGDQSAVEKSKRHEDLEKKLAEATKEVKYVGPETINGLPSFAYTFSLEMTVQGQMWTGTGKAWVGAADGLPHQIDSEFQVGKYRKNRISFTNTT